MKLLLGFMLGIAVSALAQSATVTAAGGITTTTDPNKPQMRITCLRAGAVAFEIDDVDGNVVQKILCPP